MIISMANRKAYKRYYSNSKYLSCLLRRVPRHNEQASMKAQKGKMGTEKKKLFELKIGSEELRHKTERERNEALS